MVAAGMIKNSLFPAEIPVTQRDAHTGQTGKAVRKLSGDGDRAVFAARTSNRERSVALVFSLESGKHRGERRDVCLDEFGGALAAQHIILNGGIHTREGAKLRLPEWIRQEPHVSHQVDIGRCSV